MFAVSGVFSAAASAAAASAASAAVDVLGVAGGGGGDDSTTIVADVSRSFDSTRRLFTSISACFSSVGGASTSDSSRRRFFAFSFRRSFTSPPPPSTPLRPSFFSFFRLCRCFSLRCSECDSRAAIRLLPRTCSPSPIVVGAFVDVSLAVGSLITTSSIFDSVDCGIGELDTTTSTIEVLSSLASTPETFGSAGGETAGGGLFVSTIVGVGDLIGMSICCTDANSTLKESDEHLEMAGFRFLPLHFGNDSRRLDYDGDRLFNGDSRSDGRLAQTRGHRQRRHGEAQQRRRRRDAMLRFRLRVIGADDAMAMLFFFESFSLFVPSSLQISACLSAVVFALCSLFRPPLCAQLERHWAAGVQRGRRAARQLRWVLKRQAHQVRSESSSILVVVLVVYAPRT